MPKKPPSLKRQTEWAEDRAAYASVVLAGVVIVKRKHTSLKPWPRVALRWFIDQMPKANYRNGPFLTRRDAVKHARHRLEEHS